MITFFSPFRTFGGVEQLIVNLARELQGMGEPYKILTPHDSPQWRLLSESTRADHLFDTDDLLGSRRGANAKMLRRRALTSDDILLLPNPYDAVRFRWSNPRTLFWNVFPDTIRLGNGRLTRFLNRRLKTWMVQRLNQQHSLCFIDASCARWMRRVVGTAVDPPEFLPVPSRPTDRIRYRRLDTDLPEELTLTYAGRALDWKILPCAVFLNRAAADVAIRQVHVFTDDPPTFRKHLEIACRLPVQRFTFHQGLLDSAFKAKLAEESDLHFAMGTAALDGAGLGIPTVVVDAFSDITCGDQANYRWLHESREHGLGELLTAQNPESPGRPLGGLLSELRMDHRRVSEQCHQYVKAHHDLAIVSRRFVDLMHSTQARLRCLHMGCMVDAAEMVIAKARRQRAGTRS